MRRLLLAAGCLVACGAVLTTAQSPPQQRPGAAFRAGIDVVQLGVGEPGFPPPPEVVDAVAAAVAAGDTHYTDSRGLYTLREAIAERGGASLVVCGGSSPVELFEYLAQAELDWSQVVVVPSDERWVPADDAQSNERMLRDTLLTGRAADAMFVSLYRPTDRPADAVSDVEGALLICNGYKDREYIELVLLAKKLGRRPIIVIEQLESIHAEMRDLGEKLFGERDLAVIFRSASLRCQTDRKTYA